MMHWFLQWESATDDLLLQPNDVEEAPPSPDPIANPADVEEGTMEFVAKALENSAELVRTALPKKNCDAETVVRLRSSLDLLHFECDGENDDLSKKHRERVQEMKAEWEPERRDSLTVARRDWTFGEEERRPFLELSTGENVNNLSAWGNRSAGENTLPGMRKRTPRRHASGPVEMDENATVPLCSPRSPDLDGFWEREDVKRSRMATEGGQTRSPSRRLRPS